LAACQQGHMNHAPRVQGPRRAGTRKQGPVLGCAMRAAEAVGWQRTFDRCSISSQAWGARHSAGSGGGTFGCIGAVWCAEEETGARVRVRMRSWS
jgi:hypothetical protein